MSDVGAVAEFGSNAIKLAMNFLNPSQRKLMEKSEKEALSDNEKFKVNLLENDSAECELMLGCLVCESPCELTVAELNSLRSISVTTDAASYLRTYECANEANKLRKQLQTALTATKS